MRKIIALGIMLLFLGMTISSSTGLYLEKQSVKPVSFGNILYVGGNGTGNYSKIQDAINDSENGDTVYVYDDSSPYYENIVVNKSINLIGEHGYTTIIDGHNLSADVKITADWVTISRFTMRNGIKGIYISSNYNTISENTISSNNVVGIYLTGDSNTILSNDIKYNSRYGILLEDSSHNEIMGNTIYSNNGSGLQFYKSNTNNTIISNGIGRNTENGIYLTGDSNIIWGNNINSNSRNGIILEDSSRNNTIIGNHINSNSDGIMLTGDGHNTITDNTIKFNVDDGIFLLSSSNNTITGNNIRYNRDGIYLQHYSNSNTITNNNISRNNMSILLENSNNNTFLKNNFLNNKRHAFFRGCRENTWKQNYWNRPRILPKIIFGRIGIYSLIPWINIDWHPAQELYDI